MNTMSCLAELRAARANGLPMPTMGPVSKEQRQEELDTIAERKALRAVRKAARRGYRYISLAYNEDERITREESEENMRCVLGKMREAGNTITVEKRNGFTSITIEPVA